jgi:glycosyltransferase involved in cell wall biosynthesis
MAATEGLRREIVRESGGRRVFCVYNGFPAALATIRPERHARFTLCFHGVLGFFQDVEALVRLAADLLDEEIDLVAIGYGRKAELLADSKLPNLRFLGRLPFEQTMAEVSRCHVGLCLRRGDEISRDAFPVKVWEYLGLGLPSIITPVCEAGDFLVRHGCGIQLPAGDPAALRAAVLALRDDRGRLEDMRRRCADAGRNFSRERTGLLAARIFASAYGLRRRVSGGAHPDAEDGLRRVAGAVG